MSSATSSAASSAEPGPPRPVDPRTLRGPAPEEAVDGAVAALAGLADRPLVEHVAVFEHVHVALGHALADGAVADGAAGTPGRV